MPQPAPFTRPMLLSTSADWLESGMHGTVHCIYACSQMGDFANIVAQEPCIMLAKRNSWQVNRQGFACALHHAGKDKFMPSQSAGSCLHKATSDYVQVECD